MTLRSLFNATHWTDQSGNTLLVADMELSHVGNLMRYLERNAAAIVHYMPFPDANGDMAQLGLEGEWYAAQENPQGFIRTTPLYRALAARFAPKDTMTTDSIITSIVLELRPHPNARIDRDDVAILEAALKIFSKATLGASLAVLSYENHAGECFEYSDDDHTPPHGIPRPDLDLPINQRIVEQIEYGNFDDARELLTQIGADPLEVVRLLVAEYSWRIGTAVDRVQSLDTSDAG